MSNKPERPSVDLSETVEGRINKALQSLEMIAICEAIRDALRRHNVSDIAKRAGMERTSIYRAFGGPAVCQFVDSPSHFGCHGFAT